MRGETFYTSPTRMANVFWSIQPLANASVHLPKPAKTARRGKFSDIGGIAVDEEGFVYVSDSAAGAIRKFPPFPLG